MEYTYPPSNEVQRGDNQSYPQSARGTFVNDYPSCMYDCPQATTSRYSVQNSQTITLINTQIGFMLPVCHFPDATQCAIVAAGNQQQLRLYIVSLQKLLQNFTVYHFWCQLTIKVYGSYLGQTHVGLVLRKTKMGITAHKDFTFQSQVVIKEKLKQAMLELAQPLLTDLLPCSCCNLKHYKKNCMCPFLLNTNSMSGH